MPPYKAKPLYLHCPLCLQLADVVDNEAMQVYMKPSMHEESKAPSKGFVVRDAPWAAGNNEKVSAASAPAPPEPPLPRDCPWAKDANQRLISLFRGGPWQEHGLLGFS